VPRQRYARLGDQTPDRVEAGVAGRHVAVVAVGRWAGDGDQDAGAGVEHAAHLGHGAGWVGEGDHRGGVEPALAPVEAPVLVVGEAMAAARNLPLSDEAMSLLVGDAAHRLLTARSGNRA
jgi:hypothetical protein